jgi:hypothetical protein
MKSSTTPRFWKGFDQLPKPIQKAARKQYKTWQSDPRHRSLHFKPIGDLWSVRVTDDYRALAIYENGTYFWFWIGTHADYDQILRGK